MIIKKSRIVNFMILLLLNYELVDLVFWYFLYVILKVNKINNVIYRII